MLADGFDRSVSWIYSHSGTASIIAYSEPGGNGTATATKSAGIDLPNIVCYASKRYLQTFAVRRRGAHMVHEIIGPRVGDLAPLFALPTGDGQDVRLADILNARAAMLVFIRGTW
jgi:hypothetical protein